MDGWEPLILLAWIACALLLWSCLVSSMLLMHQFRRTYRFSTRRCENCHRRFGVRAAMRAIDVAWLKFTANDEPVEFGGRQIACRHCRRVNGLTHQGAAISRDWIEYLDSLE